MAYEVLQDPEKRARYDRFGPEGVFGRAAGAGGFGFEGGLGDIFEAFFGQMAGGGGRRRGPAPGSDAEVQVRLDFAEAVFGCRKELSVRLPVTCDACEGRGTAPGTEPVVCRTARRGRAAAGPPVAARPGRHQCRLPALRRDRALPSRIPAPAAAARAAGSRSAPSRWRCRRASTTARRCGWPSRGAAGQRGGPPGSFFVHLAVTPDPRFEREGDNLHTTLTIGLAQAALGTAARWTPSRAPSRYLRPGTQHGLHGADPRRGRAASARPRPGRPLRPRDGGDAVRADAAKRSCFVISPPPEARRWPHPAGAATACSPDCAPPLASAGRRATPAGGHRACGPPRRPRSSSRTSPIWSCARGRTPLGPGAPPAGRRGGHRQRWGRGMGAHRWTGRGGAGGDWAPAAAGDSAGPGGDGRVQFEARPPALTVAFAPTKGERPDGWSRS